MQLDDSQALAVELVCTAALGVVTGGPGTGKSTSLRVALDRLDERGQRYLLAGPTGKSARRLEEVTGRRASTIHRMLGYSPNGWCYHANNPLDVDVVIIDEASMIDVELAQSLLEAIAAPTRLILIGDANQLPSVGPGRVFGELIESGRVPVARLTTLHRSARESWICSNAPVILGGRVPDLSQRERRDFWWLERADRDAAVEALVEVVTRGLPAIGVDGAQALIPQNVGPAGSRIFNRRLQAIMNRERPGTGWKVAGDDNDAEELRRGDRVIQIRNDYDLSVFNGEVGIVVEVGDARLAVDFGEPERPRLVAYDRDHAFGLRLAYALTVHKSQGSEFAWAVVFCHSTHTRMLTRQLLYTAITRAKLGVVIVGDRLGIERAVANERDAKRNTSLADRLREDTVDA